jgi:hypothetical protein
MCRLLRRSIDAAVAVAFVSSLELSALMSCIFWWATFFATLASACAMPGDRLPLGGRLDIELTFNPLTRQ